MRRSKESHPLSSSLFLFPCTGHYNTHHSRSWQTDDSFATGELTVVVWWKKEQNLGFFFFSGDDIKNNLFFCKCCCLLTLYYVVLYCIILRYYVSIIQGVSYYWWEGIMNVRVQVVGIIMWKNTVQPHFSELCCNSCGKSAVSSHTLLQIYTEYRSSKCCVLLLLYSNGADSRWCWRLLYCFVFSGIFAWTKKPYFTTVATVLYGTGRECKLL